MGSINEKAIALLNLCLQRGQWLGINFNFMMASTAKEVMMWRTTSDLVDCLTRCDFGFDDQSHVEEKMQRPIDSCLVDRRRLLLNTFEDLG